jgi:hypothetical protein
LVATAGIAVQHGIDAERVTPDPTDDLVKRHHLPHDGVVGKPSPHGTGEHVRDLREPQAEQPEVDEAESEREPGDGTPPRLGWDKAVGPLERVRHGNHGRRRIPVDPSCWPMVLGVVNPTITAQK